MFAVSVSFSERGVWSKGYTYKSHKAVEPGTLVIVPVGTHWAVARVLKYKEGYEFKSGLDYKFIHSEFHP